MNELTGAETGGNRLLPLIDAACGAALQALESEERTLRTEIQQLFAAQDQQEAVRENIRRLRQELAELDRQWQARQDVQQEALTHQYAQQANHFLETLRARIREEADRIRGLAEDLGDAYAPLGSESTHWPQSEWFQTLDRNIEALTRNVQQQLEQAASSYEAAFLAYTEQDSGWSALNQELESAESRFLDACRARGLQPADVSRLCRTSTASDKPSVRNWPRRKNRKPNWRRALKPSPSDWPPCMAPGGDNSSYGGKPSMTLTAKSAAPSGFGASDKLSGE